MFDKLKNLSEHISQAKNAITFDASRFNDPLAEQIQWTALESGGSNFKTHKLIEVSPSRMEFQPTLGSKLFGLLFIASGVIIPIVFILTSFQSQDPEMTRMSLFSILFGAVFVGVGYLTYRKFSIPIVFDKVNGRFWKGKTDNDQPNADKEGAMKLSDVYAVQLISQYVKRDKKSYYIYELNFVMGDTKRYNMIRHGGKRQIRRDAEKLSGFLGIPLWDAAG